MQKFYKKKKSVKENFLSIFYAVFAALLIRSFLYEPFSIPSGSMYPNLMVGDYLFVSKYSYGFSKHSLPFSVPIIPGRIFSKDPIRGEIIVFKTPEDNKTDYIKRLIGLPGDKVSMKSNKIYVNGMKIEQEFLNDEQYKDIEVSRFEESLNNKNIYQIFEFKKSSIFINTDDFDEITVPKDHFFVLGDNRDNSQDSRFIGTIPRDNLVGRAEIVFLSFDTKVGSFLKFWTWYPALRKNRFFYSLLPYKEDNLNNE